eukprot:363897-Chlamydomonas_euryale.AAC.27
MKETERISTNAETMQATTAPKSQGTSAVVDLPASTIEGDKDVDMDRLLEQVLQQLDRRKLMPRQQPKQPKRQKPGQQQRRQPR